MDDIEHGLSVLSVKANPIYSMSMNEAFSVGNVPDFPIGNNAINEWSKKKFINTNKSI